MIEIGRKVVIYANLSGERIGTVVGVAAYQYYSPAKGAKLWTNGYLIELDVGFYSEDKRTFTSTILANCDSVTRF